VPRRPMVMSSLPWSDRPASADLRRAAVAGGQFANVVQEDRAL
jgi:hypothetical protein